MERTIRRRTQIDIETHEIVVIRTTGERAALICGQCGHVDSDDIPGGSESDPVGLEGNPAGSENDPV
jgi:hypothetical protein